MLRFITGMVPLQSVVVASSRLKTRRDERRLMSDDSLDFDSYPKLKMGSPPWCSAERMWERARQAAPGAAAVEQAIEEARQAVRDRRARRR